ncbi:metal ABC transporter ATP-binding protein [Helicobacter burdigaliensis]|uniref:metal ABC transporter ATP-binding protein n=1 Tax=Helicobacter burdigaliensis TaxID=2315334 RepID=UPI000EF755BB|nr:metal ABC transporter ATP-binding protein [Helicobacter burdigaliensis]
MKLFDICNLNYSYKEELVLKNINLNYDSKDFLAIIGPNGGGKSTLIKLILGILEAKVPLSFFIPKNKIGYVPQNPLPNPNFPLRVLEVVLMGRIDKKKFGFYSKEDKESALNALKKVELQDFWDRSIQDLSGGQIQRVFIARALVSECKLLILDEPTASVDSKMSIQIFELLKTLHHQGIGIILICHNINLILAYANKIAHLNKELTLHTNHQETQKSQFLKHLLKEHNHFCDVELSLNQCECEENLKPKNYPKGKHNA